MSSEMTLISVGEMRERVGQDTRTYLTGAFGSTHIFIVKTDRKAEDGSAIWDVLMQGGWHHPNVSEYLLPDPL